MNRLDVDRSDPYTELLGGLRHELAEVVPLSLRSPDVDYLQLVSGAEAYVVQAPGGGSPGAVVRSEGVTALVATHDPALLDIADSVLQLEDGRITQPAEKP